MNLLAQRPLRLRLHRNSIYEKNKEGIVVDELIQKLHKYTFIKFAYIVPRIAFNYSSNKSNGSNKEVKNNNYN